MRKKWWRAAVVVAALAALGIWLAWSLAKEKQIGVEIISPEEASQYLESLDEAGSWELRYHRESVAMDNAASTVYLSCLIQPDTSPEQLLDGLALEAENARLCFVADEAVEDLQGAVAQGHVFTLLVMDDNGCCTKYNLVFTTLPLIAIQAAGVNGDNICGDVCVWEPYDGTSAIVHKTPAEWHVRGGSSQYYPKKSWKLSLKTEDGENQNIDLLGLGADDDWILNSMNMDDARIKDKLAMDIWNSIAATSESDYPASTGEYVEFFLNGEYRGVYLLQRRIDRKYLALRDEILFKGNSGWGPETVVEAYEIIYSTMHSSLTYDLMTGLWKDASKIDLDNFVDISILLQLGYMPDNSGNKNMYYLVRQAVGEYRISMIPWDMDLSFGITWNDGFAYDYNGSLNASILRQEYDDVQTLYPDLDERIAERWFELRENVLSWEVLSSILYEAEDALVNSGAYARDAALWPGIFHGEDTHEALEQWLWERLQWCDAYYSN